MPTYLFFFSPWLKFGSETGIVAAVELNRIRMENSDSHQWLQIKSGKFELFSHLAPAANSLSLVKINKGEIFPGEFSS